MRHLICILLLLGSSWGNAASAHAPEQLAAHVVIHRDEFGVPRILGDTDAAAVFGLAFAQAEDNFPHLEDTILRAIGRAAEVHGEAGVRDDRMVAALDIVRLSQEEYVSASNTMREIYDAYAAGINFYLLRHPEERRALQFTFQAWHTLAVLRYKYHLLEFVGYAGLNGDEVRPVEAGLRLRPAGSNAWAIAPSRSTSGGAMLLINPHVGFFGPAQYYEAHIVSREGWNFSGVGRYGFPFPYMGHNEFLGWAHTDNYPDIGDLYAERFDDPRRPLAYRYGAGWRNARQTQHEIAVWTPSGVETRVFSVTRTHHGPVVTRWREKPITIRLSRLAEHGWYDQWFAMTKARSLREFRTALTRGAIAYMNITYADRAGNIFYVYNGAVPRRRIGPNFAEPVDGSDPRTEWRGYHRFDELPQVLNPRGGFVQNTNSSPFFATSGENSATAHFPDYMIGPEDFNPRAQTSHRILAGQNAFSFDRWANLATDTYMMEAERLTPELLAALETTNADLRSRLAPVADLIARWDRRAEIDSIATTLFVHWYLKMLAADMPVDATRRLTLLDQVREELTETYGDWRVPWGELNRLQRRHWSGTQLFSDTEESLPVRGAPGWTGVVFNFYTSPGPSMRSYGRMGNSYVSIVEFARQTRSRSVVYFGQSGRTDSPHYFDQAPLYAIGAFRPVSTIQAPSSPTRAYSPLD